MKPNRILFLGIICLFANFTFAQNRFQQKVEYKMEIDFDVEKHQFEGEQKLVYFNNSEETLTKVYYHLYFNAFQPESAMDVRSRTITDPDGRVKDRIQKLSDKEIGYQKIKSLKQNGKKLDYVVEGTVLEVTLKEPIKPKSKATFEMKFEGQVPIQVRRSGRFSKEGIDYSMAQWYPKICEFDEQGWHANPYIAREFHGVWGDFDVTINIDKRYVVGGTGYLQKENDIKKDTKKWHFLAPNVHDFVWAADPDYKHNVLKFDENLDLHFYYVENEKTKATWEAMPLMLKRAFELANQKYGRYPYKQYSFIQGGDGGMEYPMATLVLGERGLGSTLGTSVHEMMHAWFQGMMATNESLYAWMDEGFTDYATTVILSQMQSEGVVKGMRPEDGGEFSNTYQTYFNYSKSGYEEALTIHSDHFQTNRAYSINAYVKGAVFLHQLEYVLGKPTFDKVMLRYYNEWRFKHPNPNDFTRIAEKESGLELDWYKEYWMNTTHTIDYAVKGVDEDGKKTKVILQRIGLMPMPLDVEVTYNDGTKQVFYVPLDVMRGEKMNEFGKTNFTIMPDWTWVKPTYELFIPQKLSNIKSIEIDPSKRMADVNEENHVWKKE